MLKLVDKLQTPFYLTGGTALSRFYFNHRYSDDLDFFVNKDSNFAGYVEKIISKLQENFEIEVVTKAESFCSLKVSKILKVDMVNDVAFHYGDLVKKDAFSKVDNIENILSNKISALVSRDEAKDVVDILIIAKSMKVNWKNVFVSANSKAAGIFPPDVAKRLVEFPLSFLDRIKWIDEERFDAKEFQKDIDLTCDAILKVK